MLWRRLNELAASLLSRVAGLDRRDELTADRRSDMTSVQACCDCDYSCIGCKFKVKLDRLI